MTAAIRSIEAAHPTRHSVPKVVKILLAVTGRHQKDLAAASHLTQAAVSERLAGKSRISVDEAAAWADVLEVSVAMLFSDPERLIDQLRTPPDQQIPLSDCEQQTLDNVTYLPLHTEPAEAAA